MGLHVNTSELIAALPPSPSPDVSQRYSFIDTRKVVEDMRDLGYTVAGFRRPKFRTKSGAYGLHEVDFRRPEDVARPAAETPRVLFLNTYDGSRRAQVITGVFRLVCLNGLVTGAALQNEKFLHLGDYEEELVAQIKGIGRTAAQAFDRIEKFKSQKVDKGVGFRMAEAALEIRGDLQFEISPANALLPRRREDVKADLWTTWNRLQENLLKGGIPGVDENGNMRTTRALTQIQKSNDVNRRLWDLLEKTSAAI